MELFVNVSSEKPRKSLSLEGYGPPVMFRLHMMAPITPIMQPKVTQYTIICRLMLAREKASSDSSEYGSICELEKQQVSPIFQAIQT
jgi:hypothetical protein